MTNFVTEASSCVCVCVCERETYFQFSFLVWTSILSSSFLVEWSLSSYFVLAEQHVILVFLSLSAYLLVQRRQRFSW